MTLIKYIGQAMCLGLILALAACSAEPPQGTAKAVVESPAKAQPSPTVATAPKPAAKTAAKPATPTIPPAPAKPAAPATPATPATPAPAPTAQATHEFKITPDSSIGFVGYNLLGGREGGFSNFNGAVTVKGGDLETAQINVTIDMASVFSDSSILTPKLKGDKGFFEVAKYPKSTFKSSKIAKTDKGYTVTGDLNLHGIDKIISFPATITLNGKELTAKADFSVNRHDWKIEYAGTGNFAVKDDVLIKLDIKAVAT